MTDTEADARVVPRLDGPVRRCVASCLLALLVAVFQHAWLSPGIAVAASVPCQPIGSGHYECFFDVAGNGLDGGAPVQATDGRTVGYLHRGKNWVVCQEAGGRVTAGAYFNSKWAWTLADNHKAGWVNAVWASGGDNDAGFGGVPPCGEGKGAPPRSPGSAPAPSAPQPVVAGPGVIGEPEPLAPFIEPDPSVEPFESLCSSRYIATAVVRTRTQGFVISMRPTKRIREPGDVSADVWRDLQRCVRFPPLTDGQSNSIFKQMRCHIGQSRLGDATWDFESWRPDVSMRQALRWQENHGCKWDRSAWRDTTKCVVVKPFLTPRTCIRVHGGGLDVGYVELGVTLGTRQTSYGHWQLFLPGQPENTDELRLRNSSSLLGKIVWGPRLTLNRSLRHGSKLCATWWRNDDPGNGRWSERGRACVTVKR